MAYPYDDEDRRAALTQGLLAAGLAALGARKGSEFNALAQAGLLGLGGYNTSLKNATDARESQAMMRMREQQWQQQQAEYQRQQQERAALQGAHAAAIIPAVPGGEAEPREGGMTPGIAGGFDDAKYIQALRTNPNIDPTKALAYQQLLAKPQKELKEIITATVGGEPRQVAFYKDGTREVLPYGPKQDEEWEDIPPPKGAPAGQQWQRSRLTKQIRAVGSLAPQVNVQMPHWDSAAGQFVTPPSATNPTGAAVTPAGFTKPDKPLTESQAKATAFVNQMEDASQTLSTLALKGFDGRTAGQQAAIVAAGSDGWLGAMPRLAAGADAQKYQQAELQWTEAALRFMTGANAPEAEVKRNAATYFPRPGDSEELVAQKAQKRAAFQESVRMAAGATGRKELEKKAAAPVKSFDSLPDPKGFKEGSVMTDTNTGRKFKKVNGTWKAM